MTYPTNVPGLKGAVIVKDQAITVYGNTEFFTSLSKWASWLAESPATEKFTFKFLWHLGDAGFNENVSLIDARTFNSESEVGLNMKDSYFELSFYVLEDEELEPYLEKA